MADIKRYQLVLVEGRTLEMRESPKGSYVDYLEYEKLEDVSNAKSAMIEILRRELDQMRRMAKTRGWKDFTEAPND
jgi:hypothetical protein